MCLNCGCDLPYEDWDNPDNITVDTIKKATATPKALGLTANQVINRIMSTWHKAKESDKQFKSADWNHSVGDIIDDLMDEGMNKSNAVAKAEELKDDKYNDRMRAIHNKAR